MTTSENMADSDGIETLYMYCEHGGRCIAIAKSPELPNHASIIVSYVGGFTHLTLTPKERDMVIKALRETACPPPQTA